MIEKILHYWWIILGGYFVVALIGAWVLYKFSGLGALGALAVEILIRLFFYILFALILLFLIKQFSIVGRIVSVIILVTIIFFLEKSKFGWYEIGRFPTAYNFLVQKLMEFFDALSKLL